MAIVNQTTEVSVTLGSGGETDVKFSYTGRPMCEVYVANSEGSERFEADKGDLEELIAGLQIIVAAMK